MNELQSGAHLQGGKYKIEKSLGQGGFGITYLAEQTNLGRKVCIKEFFMKEYGERTAVPSENSGDDTVIVRESATVLTEVTAVTSVAAERMEVFRKRFVKEAKTIAKLYHPGVVGIHDVFEENGTAYYVMDFIEGENLNDMVKREGALSEERALGYIRQVADALSYVHSHNIMHLDVKPANIIVRKSDDKAILIDFGAAKQYDSEGSQTSTTPIGISVGYAPLEMTKPGGVQTFSPETDVYSLGATLYYLVTGQNPPDASERMEMIMEGEKFQLPDNISSSTAEVIDRSMQPRKKRIQTVKGFVDFLNSDGQKRRLKTAESAAKEVEEKALQERPKKESKARAKNNEVTQNKKGKETLPKTEKPSEKPLSSAPTDYHQLFNKGLFWFEESLTLKDEDILPLIDLISRDAKKRDVKAMTLMGYHYYLQQDYGKAQAFYDDAYSTLKKDESASNSIFMAGLCFDLAQVILRKGKTMTALDGFENCLKKLEESKEDTSEEKAMVYYHMGRVRAGMGHSRIGMSCIDKALSILEKNKSKHALGIGIIYNLLALWNSYPYSYKEALQFHLKALKSFQQLEEGTLKTSMIKKCNDSIGGDYYCLEDYPKALEYYSLAKNNHRINQVSEIVSYSEKDKRIKCSFDNASVYLTTVEFTFSFDSIFNNSNKLFAKFSVVYLGTDFPIRRIKNNKLSFSIPVDAIRRNKYFTLIIDIYRLFKSNIEDADKLDYYLLDSKRFNFSRKRHLFGGVKSVSIED